MTMKERFEEWTTEDYTTEELMFAESVEDNFYCKLAAGFYAGAKWQAKPKDKEREELL